MSADRVPVRPWEPAIARRTTSSRPGARPARGSGPSSTSRVRRRPGLPEELPDADAIPVVGLRQPCPCGSGRRYKACHGGRRRAAPVLRPFVGRDDEPDLVALRQLVPSATAPLKLSEAHLAAHPEHADRTILLTTLLPQAAPAVVRNDGEILVAMQTIVSGLDPSADLAAALLAALDAKPGTVVDIPPASSPPAVEKLPDGLASLPRLTDILDPAPLQITVHQDFAWWLPSSEEDESAGATGEAAAALDRANATVVPTQRLRSVEAAYWCKPEDRVHLRWVLPLARSAEETVPGQASSEEELLDALARLATAGRLTVGEGSRYVGAFRADGLVVPVWDLAPDADAESCEEPAAALQAALAEVLADPRPLTAEERRIRAGVVGRTLTLR